MRRLLGVLSLLAIAGCGASGPCDGRSGTCIALTVDGDISGIDTLAISVDQPTPETKSTPVKSVHLPITVGLNLPASVEGSVNITIVASGGGNVLARGTGMANVVANSATLTIDLAGNPGDLGNGDGIVAGDGGDNGVPGAPTSVVASSGNAEVSISWTAPTSDGGSPITGYSITSTPGGATMTTTATTTSVTFSGLMNDTTYTFTVFATNANGNGPSAMSNGATPTATPTVPSAPTMVVAVANIDSGASLSWTASDNHGSPLQGYTITSSQVSGTLMSVTGTATSTMVTGLTPGTTYNFNITATNGIGTSTPSLASNNIVAATKPGTPTAVGAVANVNDGATVTWTAPTSTGFSPITKYTAVASPGGAMATVDGTTLTTKVTGLTAGTMYTFTVYATNLIGDGTPSTASSPITALAALAAPTGIVACGSDGAHIAVTFNAVAGATSYNIYYSTTSPATGGTKVNTTSSPYALTPPAQGSYYVQLTTVNGAGEGPPSAAKLIPMDGKVHDTLFAVNTIGVDIFDCVSQTPTATATTTRQLTIISTNPEPYDNAIAVDAVNSVIWVTDSNPSNAATSVRAWTNANTVNGTVGSSYEFALTNPGGIAVDPVHKYLYVGIAGGDYIYRYAIEPLVTTNPVSFSTGGSLAQVEALYTDNATGNLWVAYAGGSPSGAAALYAAAYNLASNAGPTKTFRLGPSNGTSYNGIAYSPAAGGTLYAGSAQNGLEWLTGIDAEASGTYTPTGSSAATAVWTLGAGNSLVFDLESETTTSISAFSTASLTGKAVFTTATAAADYAGFAYVP